MEGTLHLVTSGKQPLADVLRMVEAAVRGGVDVVHLREKERSARELLEWTEALSRVIPRERIVINDRVDVAAAARCGGSHLAHHSLPPDWARRVLVEGQRLGKSVHSLDEAVEAYRQGADYLYFGHVFASASKPGRPPRGLEQLARVAAAVSLPVIAIGGITPERVPDVLAAGSAGIAVLSGITESADPEAAARAYREALDNAVKGGGR